MRHSDYLAEAMLDTQGIIERARESLAGVRFDAVVVTGISGLLMGPLLAHVLGKRLAVVRKDNDQPNSALNHAQVGIESNMKAGDRWILVDDLIASGETARRVELAMMAHGYGKMVGNYLYNQDTYNGGSWT